MTYTVYLEYFATGEGLLRQIMVVNATSPEAARERFREVFYGSEPEAWEYYQVGVVVREGLDVALLQPFLAPRVVERLQRIHEHMNELWLHWHVNLS
ncbi:hypothetical protein [Deinococcus yavapaiensis]|uniref:Uncharacterized protein n=1 Tax=Deinococcus yavapaiensis KR-236 TaxID=694435 RepID=A0A318S7F8_9DEIO|nr:hypothetical protein [Deinococcus yavapaiensis]PYE52979.1 hypothetical protein DES52_111152 [Deinococcus yavapaiensis KR-236]